MTTKTRTRTRTKTVPLVLVVDVRDQRGEIVDSHQWTYPWPLGKSDFEATFNSIRVDAAGPLMIRTDVPREVPKGKAIGVQVTVVKSPDEVRTIVRGKDGQATGSVASKPVAPYMLDERWPTYVALIKHTVGERE